MFTVRPNKDCESSLEVNRNTPGTKSSVPHSIYLEELEDEVEEEYDEELVCIFLNSQKEKDNDNARKTDDPLLMPQGGPTTVRMQSNRNSGSEDGNSPTMISHHQTSTSAYTEKDKDQKRAYEESLEYVSTQSSTRNNSSSSFVAGIFPLIDITKERAELQEAKDSTSQPTSGGCAIDSTMIEKEVSLYYSDQVFRFRRLHYFQRARQLRRATYHRESHDRRQCFLRLCGFFSYLTETFIDLQWAEEAAQRCARGETYVSWAEFEASNRFPVRLSWFVYVLTLAWTLSLIISFQVNRGQGIESWQSTSWLADISMNPFVGPSPNALVTMGALSTARVALSNEWYRLLTPVILHAGVIHYVINMITLWSVGRAIEFIHGTLHAASLYLLCAVGGNVMALLFVRQSFTVGSSVGLLGLTALCFVEVLIHSKLFFTGRNEDDIRDVSISVVYWTCLGVFLQFFIGLVPYFSTIGNLGGMLYGILWGLPILSLQLNNGYGSKARFWRAKSKSLGGKPIACEPDDRDVPSRHRRLCLGWFYRLLCLATASSLLIGSSVLLMRRMYRYSKNPSNADKCDLLMRKNDAALFYTDDTISPVANSSLPALSQPPWLQFTCPYSNNRVTAVLDNNSTLLDPDVIIRSRLPDLCRRHCYV